MFYIPTTNRKCLLKVSTKMTSAMAGNRLFLAVPKKKKKMGRCCCCHHQAKGVGQCNTRECAAASRQEGSPPPSPRNFFPYVLVVVSIQYRIGTKRREEGALVDIGVRLVSSSFDGKRFSVAPIIKVNTRYSIFSVRSVTTLFFIRKSDCK